MEMIIYIAEPINAVSGTVLLLDASNNPESIARWTNLGTSGGSLLSSDRHDRRPRVEEGEIEIPSIGFSGRRKFYTATASGQTFGGPIDTNPKLYLGDWTLEFLCKRNGNLFDLEHQFAGFQNSPREEPFKGSDYGCQTADKNLASPSTPVAINILHER